ncbi:hypothetical protein [Coraliomargarita parva]|uniref:hypothetical protein n=1 Tax=Coraliomargarita parva TaxID=3014050 RepID=UPI0022B41B44|nr:hypothetical protein [Coraliomargarita parva]
MKKRLLFSIISACCMLFPLVVPAKEAKYKLDEVSIDGGADSKGGRLVISATLGGPIDTEQEAKLIYAVQADSVLHLGKNTIRQTTELTAAVKHGKLERLELDVAGSLPIVGVSGEQVASWSLQRPVGAQPKAKASGLKLVIELKQALVEDELHCVVEARQTEIKMPAQTEALFFSPPDPSLSTGSLRIEADTGLQVEPTALAALTVRAPENTQHLPAYTYTGGGQKLELSLHSKARPDLSFQDFQLSGRYVDGRLRFTLEGVVEVLNAGEFELPLLSGAAAFSAVPEIPGAAIEYRRGSYRSRFERPGRFPVSLRFDARVETHAGRSSVAFQLMDSALQPVRLSGLPVAADRVLLNGVKMETGADGLAGSLSGDGRFALIWTDPSWKSPEPEDAALFYAAESVAQVEVGPGLIRQQADYTIHLMQGAMRRLVFDLEGNGEITQVEGDSILRWEVLDAGEGKQLALELNKAYSEDFELKVRSQYAMQAFPSKAQPLRVLPVGAIRYAGFIRLSNQGAVAFDVPESFGFAQISPEFFPAVETAVDAGTQVLAYRFSDVHYSYTLQADNILPEISVSQLLIYDLGFEDRSLQAEMELTIRKAPLRDFYIRIPEAYALSKLSAPSLADYFLQEDALGQQLRIVFAQPLSGRQVIRLSLEDNSVLEGEDWTLPVFQPMDAKSIRGHIGVVAEPGLRVNVSSIDGLVEQAVNFFPKSVSGLQLALRMRDPAWSAVLEIEKLPQAIQADVLHLYTVGEGRIYGSSVINFLISGAPVSELRIQIPEGMENLDFMGRDVRGWSDLGAGVYEVRLHAPAAGAYTLLCSYESKFESQGQTVRFSGATPLRVDSEQGFVVVISNFPFSIGAVEVSPDLIRLEPNEIPAEFRLLYDAQVLAAFQYTHRPLEIGMELKSFSQANAKDQIIDFAELKSHVSRDGEILTSVELMLKSKGQTHFRMQLPPEHRIWSAKVAGRKVNPVTVEGGILLPLPAGHEPNSALRVQLELAAESKDASNPVVYAPAMYAPSLIVNWELTSDPGFGLGYLGGDISSGQLRSGSKGFDWLRIVLEGVRPPMRGIFVVMICAGILGLLLAKLLVRKYGDFKPITKVCGFGLVLACLGVLILCGIILGEFSIVPSDLQDRILLKAPIELSTQPLSLHLVNRAYEDMGGGVVSVLPLLLGVGLCVTALVRHSQRQLFWAGGWFCLFLGALNTSGGASFFLVVLILFFCVHVGASFKTVVLSRGVTACLVIVFLLGLALPTQETEAKSRTAQAEATTVAGQIAEQIIVENDVARVDAALVWSAEAGDVYTFLRAPATLVETAPVPEGLRLLQFREQGALVYQLLAIAPGRYNFAFKYSAPVADRASAQRSLTLPVGLALSHQAQVTVPMANVQMESSQAVSILSSAAKDAKTSVFEVVFMPAQETGLTWSPERRDASKETAVYYVESYDVFTPLVGLVSGHHVIHVKLSQGQLDTLQLDIPEGMTITSVEAEHLANWQFDPEAHHLLLYFEPVQQAQFSLSLFSQYASASLPYRVTVRPPLVAGAANQLSLVALATDEDVQLGLVSAVGSTTINLEDFPSEPVQALTHLGRVPQLRRAYRWDAETGSLSLEALAVQPDIRSTVKQTISLGEDRVLIALELEAEINRAGVFKLSLPIPEDYDVEAVSGKQLSHWNEFVDSDGVRSLQLHLRGKTTGATSLNLSLSGPGLAGRTTYVPPLLQLSETDRQNGNLILVPELGYRLQSTERSAAVQLDPSQAGMQRKDVLLYRILNQDAKLAFSVEKVDPWIEVTRVQSVDVRSGVVEVKARFNFSVENAGIREQAFRLPAGATGVQFSGDAVADAFEGEAHQWLLKLNRKMVGAFTVELSYHLPTPNQPDQIVVNGAEVLEVNQQTGYLALVPHGRIQLEPLQSVDALQAAEAHMVEPKLRGDLPVGEASHVYRILESGFTIGLGVKRHQIADLVPAQVKELKLVSTLSGAGSMLTQATLKLDPGDKRMLRITLPVGSEFWFGFVNQQSVWPWREGEDVLLQLEANPIEGKDTVVEFYYATNPVLAPSSKLRASLRGPKLDLPLENISWTLHYPETWNVRDWDGNLTIEQFGGEGASFSDLNDYLRVEMKSRMQQKFQAESLLDEANQLLEQGKQEQARKAFSNAFNLSQSDDALNEDARVQLKNVREEQALVALANRRNSFINENAMFQDAAPQVEIEESQLLNYTDQLVKGVLSGNSEEENHTLRLLAARLIDQQQATPANPQAINTILPQEGKTATFIRSLQINDRADLVIEMEGTRQSKRAGLPWLGLLLLATLCVSVAYGVSRKDA